MINISDDILQVVSLIELENQSMKETNCNYNYFLSKLRDDYKETKSKTEMAGMVAEAGSILKNIKELQENFIQQEIEIMDKLGKIYEKIFNIEISTGEN